MIPRRALPVAMLALGAALCPDGLAAGEPPIRQPVLVPMARFLGELAQRRAADGGDAWVVLPYGDWRTLVGRADAAVAGRAGPAPTAATGSPAWIEEARIVGRLDEQGLLAFEAELVAVSVAEGPAIAALFPESLRAAALVDESQAPPLPALGAIEIAGAPALLCRRSEGPCLLLPGAGRFALRMRWHVAMERDARGLRCSLRLPQAAALDLRLLPPGPGAFAGAGMGRQDDAAGPFWRLAGPSLGKPIDLAWVPGAGAAGNGAAIFGVDSEVVVELHEDRRTFVWSARLEAQRGGAPADLAVVLPAGWTATVADAGVAGMGPSGGGAAGTLRLRRGGDQPLLTLRGILQDDAVLDLPTVAGAAWQAGELRIEAGAERQRYAAPSSWRPLARHRFRVAAPGSPLRLDPAAAEDRSEVAGAATLAIGPERWRLHQVLRAEIAGARRFSLPLTVPAGWTVLRLSARLGIQGLPVELPEGFSGGDLRVDMPSGAPEGAAIEIALLAERPAPVDADAAPAVFDAVPVATLPTIPRARQRLDVLIAPEVAANLAPAAGWRRLDAAPGTRAALASSGAPPRLRVAAGRKPLDAAAEAVLHVAPADAEGVSVGWWGRLDLRLAVRDREIDELVATLPFAAGATLRIDDRAVDARWADGRVRLRFAAPWTGERLLRIEGPVPVGAPVDLACAFVGASMRQTLVVQASEELAVRIDPGAGNEPIDTDALPAWSRPFPGPPLLGAWRLTAPLQALAVSRPPLAEAPRGFLDRLECLAQIEPSGTRLLLRGRLVAPGLSTLPLGLAPSWRLLRATIDGDDVDVRIESGEPVLPLPGRTQARIALLLAGPMPGGRVLLPRPALGGLPDTGTAWQVAVAGGLHASSIDAAGRLPLAAAGQGGAVRGALAGWTAPDIEDGGDLPALRFSPALRSGAHLQADPRALTPARRDEPPPGEPRLPLAGQLLHGQSGGARLDPELTLVAIDRLNADHRAGRVAALLLGLLAVLVGGIALRLGIGVAALLAVAACATGGWTPPVLLACAEALPIAVALWWIAFVGLRRMRGATGGRP